VTLCASTWWKPVTSTSFLTLRYLHEALLDAGREFGIEPDGFAGKEW
jgi:hypothetical protein